MSALSIQVPFPVFQDRDGQPLDNGYVWLGTSSLNPQTNPIACYYDAALTIAATQPLRTINGFISRSGSPTQVYVDAVNFSILVQDSKGTTVFSVPEGTGISPNASGVVYDPAGTGAVATTVQAKLRERVSVNDFGAVGDGVTDDTAAIQAAFAALTDGATLEIPTGTYLVSSLAVTIANKDSVRIVGTGGILKLTQNQPSGNVLLHFSGCTNLHIEGVVIDGDAYIANAYRFTNCSRFSFTHNTVRKLWRTSTVIDGFGLVGENCTYGSISNNTLHRTNKAIVFDDGGGISSYVDIADNIISESGFGAVIVPHQYSNVINNVISFTGLGPFYRAYGSGTTITVDNMRNDAWVPSPVTADYGTGKGTAINSGSNLFATGSYPLHLTLSGNVINQTAEYAIGIESGDYNGATRLAGPAKATAIENNSIANSGISAIWCAGMVGLSVCNNTISTVGLSGAGDAAVVLLARTGHATTDTNNGIRNAVISDNRIYDSSGVTQKAFYFDRANIPDALNNVILTDNNVYLSNTAKTWGIQLDNTGGSSDPYDGFTIVNNRFYAPAAATSALVLIAGARFVRSSLLNTKALNFGGVVNLYNIFYQYGDGISSNSLQDSNTSYAETYVIVNSNGSTGWYSGNGSPEGVVTANVGALYSRLDGGAATSLYVKQVGTGNTGWAGK